MMTDTPPFVFPFVLWINCSWPPRCLAPPHVQSFLFGQSAEVVIELDGEDKRKKVDVKNEEGKKEKLALYFDGESVSGKVDDYHA